jgi:threonine dehydrogenase-like Zn-dependent dehydrogenase
MEAAVFHGVQRIACVRVDQPQPEALQPDEAIVAVALAGLCGSDLHPYLGATRTHTHTHTHTHSLSLSLSCQA